MNARTRSAAHRSLRVFFGIVLTLAAAAAAHHGNPDAPAPAPWSQGPAAPGLPGPTKPMGPGF